MRHVKKFIVWLLVLSMIVTNIALTNLDEGFKEKIDEAKVVEQLKEDLSEEKAEEVLNSEKEQKNDVEEVKEATEEKNDKEEDETGEEDLPEEIEEPEMEEEEPKAEELEEEPEEDIEENIDEVEEVNDSLVDLDEENEIEETEGTEEEESLEEEETIDEAEEDTSNGTTEESVNENSVEDVEEEKEENNDSTEQENITEEIPSSEANENEENVVNETVDEETTEVETEQNVENESNDENKTEGSDIVDLEVPQDANQEIQIVNVNAPEVLNAFGDPSGIYWWVTDSDTVLHMSMNVPTVATYYENYTNDDAITMGLDATIETIILEDEIIAPEESNALFANFIQLTNIQNLDKLDTSNAVFMNELFRFDVRLESLDVGFFDLSNAVSMSEMFAFCENLTSLNLTGWDTSHIQNMESLFNGSYNLEKIYYFGEFDTSSLMSSSDMFVNCDAITGNGITTQSDLGGDPGPLALRVAYIDPATGDPVHGYFTPPHDPIVTFNTMGGSSIDPIDVTYGEAVSRPTNPTKDGYAIENWYTEETYDNVYDFDSLVMGDITLYAKWEESIKWWLTDGDTILHLSNAVPAGGITFNEKFDMYSVADRTSVTKIIIEDNVVLPEMSGNLFANFTNLISIQDIDKLNTSNVENMYGMFCNNGNLVSLDLSNFDTSNVTTMQQMFMSCMALTSLNLTGFDTSKVTDMQAMFGACVMLPSLDLSSFDTSLVTMMVDMFGDCASLTSVDISGFNTHNVDNMGGMFWGCTSLERVYYDGAFDTTSLTYSDDMFTDCTAINGNDITTYDDAHVDATYARSAYIDGSGNTVHGYFTSPLRTVTFNTMGGSAIAEVTVANGNAVTRPANPTKGGYTFVDWYKEEAYTNVYDFSTPVTANITLYAKWNSSSTTNSGGSGGSDDDNIIGPIKAKEMIQQKNITNVTRINNLYIGNINTVSLRFVWEKQDQGTWKMKSDNFYYTICFVNVLDLPITPYYLSTYYFNDNGLMQTGWIQNADNSWYYMETIKNVDEGRMVQGWKKIDNKWYCFANNGKLLTNTITPDGFRVNANGEWVE